MIALSREFERTDSELIGLVARGDMEPLGELYLRHGSAVRSLLGKLLPNELREEVKDLCQDVFEIVYKTAPRFQMGKEPKPWILGIAAQCARNYRRKNWLRNKLMRRYVHEQAITASSTITPPDSTGISSHKVDLAMATLPPKQREVLVLFATQSLSGEQVSDLLGININTMWTRLRRARISLSAALEGNREAGEAK